MIRRANGWSSDIHQRGLAWDGQCQMLKQHAVCTRWEVCAGPAANVVCKALSLCSLFRIAMHLQKLVDTFCFVYFQNLPRDLPAAHRALYIANEIVNRCNPFDKSTFVR